MSVEVTAVYEGSLRCAATHGPSGHALTTDAPVDNGGQGASFSPTDLVATALGTCMLTIMALVAERHSLNLTGAGVRVTKEMSSTPPRRIARLTTVLTFPADLNLSDEDRERLRGAAKHCPVHQSLHPDIQTPIEFRF